MCNAITWHTRLAQLQVSRRDWLRVARGLLAPGFWRAQLTTHPGYSWYLSRVRDTVLAARQATGAPQVVLVGHSAGGWLARAFLGDPQWFVGEDAGQKAGPGEVSKVPNPAVLGLVTLGAPQLPAPIGVRARRGLHARWHPPARCCMPGHTCDACTARQQPYGVGSLH